MSACTSFQSSWFVMNDWISAAIAVRVSTSSLPTRRTPFASSSARIALVSTVDTIPSCVLRSFCCSSIAFLFMDACFANIACRSPIVKC